MRVDVAFPPELYDELQRWMKRHKVPNASDAVRTAVAGLVGKPDLAAVARGRPKST